MPTFGFFPFIVGGSISGLLCFLVYAPPNPSLNRTPAGGLTPARRSPVSLLR
jgi:hypothetical protein